MSTATTSENKKDKKDKEETEQETNSEHSVTCKDTKTCSICNEEKDKTEFYNNRSKCKECMKTKRNQKNTDHDHKFQLIINDSIRRSNKKKEEKKPFEAENTITVKDLKDLYERQEGKCYISGDIMNMENGSDKSISLKRKDPERGFTPDNIIFVCKYKVPFLVNNDKGKTLKVCFTCKENKPISDYDKKSTITTINICKNCIEKEKENDDKENEIAKTEKLINEKLLKIYWDARNSYKKV